MEIMFTTMLTSESMETFPLMSKQEEELEKPIHLDAPILQAAISLVSTTSLEASPQLEQSILELET